MRRHNLGFLFLPLSIAAVAACSSHAGPPDLASQLRSDTGVEWTVYRDPRLNEVRFLAPKTPVQIAGATPEDKARAFIARYRDSLHASGQANEIQVVTSAQDSRGGAHIRFAHTLPGTTLPVFGAGTTAHFTKDGAVYWLETDFREDISKVDGNATITADVAKMTAEGAAPAACGSTSATAVSSDLGVLSDPDRPATLAYRVALTTVGGTCIAAQILVDAKVGTVIKLEEGGATIDTQVGGSRFFRLGADDDRKTISVTSASGTGFQMASDDEHNSQIKTHTFGGTNPIIITNDLTKWDDASPFEGAAADAHFFTRNAYLYLRSFASDFQAHGKASLVFPLALEVNATVHDNVTIGPFNAFATIDPNTNGDIIHFGDGDPTKASNALPFSAGYDVVAHELTHLVTDHTSNLKYENESGALNDAFSDIMGSSAEHAALPNDAKNFLIGEDLFIAGMPGLTALRSMTAPRSFGNPDHYEDRIQCAPNTAPAVANDECGVHGNSGIANRAFSLIVAGGSLIKFVNNMPTGTRPVGVSQGIGWETATEIAYWAFTGLNSTATFENAANAEIAEASRYFYENGDSNIPRAVVCAWTAVGVLGGSPEFLNELGTTTCIPPSTTPSPTPSPDTFCSGQPDGFICDSTAPQAIECKNGTKTGQVLTCSDTTEKCQPKSATDPTAQLDSDGIIVCE